MLLSHPTIFRCGAFSLLLALSACGGGTGGALPALLIVENHWAGNTGGRGSSVVDGDAVSNFFEDMSVLGVADVAPQYQSKTPLIVTNAFWDETNFDGGAYFNGARLEKNWWKGKTNSRSSTSGTLTATIQNFYGRFFLKKLGPPPTDATAPYVSLSDGRSIRSVIDPTAVAFDRSGRLWVADNGPDQNYKIFDVSGSNPPAQVATFGDAGGVFAGPRKGATGEKRFWGPRGIGFGAAGEIFAGSTGLPMQTMGGTDIRAYDSAGSYQWDLKGIFMHAPDIDPSSNGSRICTAAQCYEMDYGKAPGKSWRQAAITLDPFRFPEDPRLIMPHESAFVRVVDGKRFLYATNMRGDYLSVYRFEAGSEIAIPVALLYIRSSGQGEAWATGKYPTWDAGNDLNKNRRYMWRDANGDGVPQASEFVEFELPHPYTTTIDVDDLGNIWLGGKLNEYSAYWKSGGNLLIPFGGTDGNGIPLFSRSQFRFVDVPHAQIPAADVGKDVVRLRYLAASDTCLLATGDRFSFPSRVHVMDGCRNSATPSRRLSITLPYEDFGLIPSLDVNTAEMTIPASIASDGDYLYVAHGDKGPDARVRAEVTVYGLSDGRKVGWIVPGPETNRFSGAIDVNIAIQARKLADGTRIITVEENGGGKFMVYRWKPVAG